MISTLGWRSDLQQPRRVTSKSGRHECLTGLEDSGVRRRYLSAGIETHHQFGSCIAALVSSDRVCRFRDITVNHFLQSNAREVHLVTQFQYHGFDGRPSRIYKFTLFGMCCVYLISHAIKSLPHGTYMPRHAATSFCSLAIRANLQDHLAHTGIATMLPKRSS